MAEPLVRTRDLAKDYRIGEGLVHALNGVSVDIAGGQFVAVTGPSGSGKSTFLHILGCLDRPSAGEVLLSGERLSALTGDERARMRNRAIGFVFQNFNLLARTSAAENVALPLVYGGVPARERRARALEMLERVGLADRAGHLPSQLSGGQQQRVAIARALVTRPRLLLADEPTGALDSRTGEEILALLGSLNGQGLTVVLVTHEPEVARCARRVLRFLDGRLVGDEAGAEPAAA
ncbi:MAG TPA: ABC transporter ATP-binding protein [Burkholderiales bacterium]|nr:ABC transporter ATP-binding protein [Burkholderiales bacterium]